MALESVMLSGEWLLLKLTARSVMLSAVLSTALAAGACREGVPRVDGWDPVNRDQSGTNISPESLIAEGH